MENAIKIFRSEEFGQVRTLTINEAPYFVGKDVAEILGYSNINKAIQVHVDEEDKKVLDFKGFSHFGNTLWKDNDFSNKTVINESGLYSLILSSKLPKAKEFKRWVTSEVLPTIRKTGGYVSSTEQFISTYLGNVDENTKQLFRLNLNTIEQLNRKIESDKPKVLFADSVCGSETSILVGTLAKILNQNGIDIGQNRLFKWLRANGYLVSKKGLMYNTPTQYSLDLGIMEIKEKTIMQPDGKSIITRTPLITGKGQAYFVNKFLKEQSKAEIIVA